MIRYWPNQRSISLNNAIVDIFFSIERKITSNLQNRSKQYLYIDILNNLTRYELFTIILNEFKQLVLDLVELNLNKNNLKKLNQKIWLIFIDRVIKKFSFRLEYKPILYTISLKKEYSELIEYLLIYLTLGSSQIDNNIFLFETIYTPYYHVQILFENFIIKISNITVKNLIYQLKDSTRINQFLKTKKVCDKLYSSNRSIILFLNNLKWQNFIYSYVQEIRSLYNERKKIFLVSSNGIIIKYIYFSELNKLNKINNFKTFFLFWLEVKDLIIPKTEKILIQLGKYFIYFSINLFSNIILLFIRITIFYLKN